MIFTLKKVSQKSISSGCITPINKTNMYICMNIILKTDAVLYAMFHIEHIMCSIHISMWQCSVALISIARDGHLSSYSAKKVYSLSLVLLAQ